MKELIGEKNGVKLYATVKKDGFIKLIFMKNGIMAYLSRWSESFGDIQYYDFKLVDKTGSNTCILLDQSDFYRNRGKTKNLLLHRSSEISNNHNDFEEIIDYALDSFIMLSFRKKQTKQPIKLRAKKITKARIS